MMRSRAKRPCALMGAVFASALLLGAMLVNTSALASCDTRVDPAMQQTPVRDQVCGSPTPSTSPSPSARPTPSHTPTPAPTRRGTPSGPAYFGPPPAYPAGTFPTPNPSSFGSFSGFPSPAPGAIATQAPANGSFGDEPFGQQFFPRTQASGARVRPGGGGFFALRAILFLLAAIAGAWTLYEARVRRWMIGI